MNLVDTHCHIDLYPNPHIIAKESEDLGIITIGMTLLPSHFEMGFKHVSNYKKVRLALGMHPLHAKLHQSEFDKFQLFLDKTSYIGEIGLDFSTEGTSTKELQVNSFKKILSLLHNEKKIISLHSRRAEKDILTLLKEYAIPNVIFHWYSGSVNLIDEIISHGYYFSINPSMIKSENGRKVIQHIPMQNVLTESDGPFVSIGNNPIKPKDVALVLDYLSTVWKINFDGVQNQINNNFNTLLSRIK